ncbi:glutamate 5-kinase, partial [Microbacteriaceae bacterium K1510]|nr:glutamate 5-kinase [Microbacteriaceae bacterium K1510]
PAKKQWIAVHSPVRGQIRVDEGAANAILTKRRSLLLAGVKEIAGDFQAGEVVEVCRGDQVIGRGISRFDALELRVALSSVNGIRLEGEVVHRDHWIATPSL